MTIDEILYLRAAGVSAEEIASYNAPAHPVPDAPAQPVQPVEPAQPAVEPQAPAIPDAGTLADAIVAALQARNIGTSVAPAPVDTPEDVLAHILAPNAK